MGVIEQIYIPTLSYFIKLAAYKYRQYKMSRATTCRAMCAAHAAPGGARGDARRVDRGQSQLQAQ